MVRYRIHQNLREAATTGGGVKLEKSSYCTYGSYRWIDKYGETIEAAHTICTRHSNFYTSFYYVLSITVVSLA